MRPDLLFEEGTDGCPKSVVLGTVDRASHPVAPLRPRRGVPPTSSESRAPRMTGPSGFVCLVVCVLDIACVSDIGFVRRGPAGPGDGQTMLRRRRRWAAAPRSGRRTRDRDAVGRRGDGSTTLPRQAPPTVGMPSIPRAPVASRPPRTRHRSRTASAGSPGTGRLELHRLELGWSREFARGHTRRETGA
ncbi:hypothetical protein FRAHR75_1200011 [Frankia sp. Hr75.2]|nr:hypothetical protein FRAHR75_1200011 [Frankia sp. Hr75.2]